MSVGRQGPTTRGFDPGSGETPSVARFARLNGLSVRDALPHLDDVGTPSPRLRALEVAARLSERVNAGDASAVDALFHAWAAAHGVIAHPGVTWSRVRTLGRYSPLVLTLAAVLRLNTRSALDGLDADVRRAETALEAAGAGAHVFEQLFDDVRSFADPTFPWWQAGVHLSPVRAWSWTELEHFSALLTRRGLRGRFGLRDDQRSPRPSTPIVLWNPALTAMRSVAGPVGSGSAGASPVGEVELRVVARHG